MANIGISRGQITSGGSSAAPSAGGDWYSVKTYGATGSGKIAYTDITITSGTPNLTSAQGPWLPSDAGKTIMVAGAGSNGTDLWTTISAYVSATAVTLAANASTTVNPAANSPQPNLAVWGGTDDTSAIQSCINAAAAAEVGVYFPPGIYIISATLTLPSTYANPTLFFGEGAFSVLVWTNPSIATYAPFMTWTANDYGGFTFRDLTFVGGSCQWISQLATSPTAGYLISVYSPSSTFSNLAIVNNSFLGGFDIQASFGKIQGLVDMSQSRFQMDTTLVSGCQAAGFIFGGPIGVESGVVNGCLAQGDWPISNNYFFDSNGGNNEPPTLINCTCAGGANANTVHIGFNLPAASVAINCYSEYNQVGFLLGAKSQAINCSVGPGLNLASFVVSNGELPWSASVPYFLGQQIIDTNGNYQQVTSPGTSGLTNPPTGGWATSVGLTTTDGTITWTMIANPGNTTVTGALLNNCSDALGTNPISLYDIGSRTVQLNSQFTHIQIAPNPAIAVLTGITTQTSNYTVKLTDVVVKMNPSTAATVLMPYTGQIGQKWTIKNVSSVYITIQMVSGGATFDGYTSLVLLPYQSFDLEWDGTNFSIV